MTSKGSESILIRKMELVCARQRRTGRWSRLASCISKMLRSGWGGFAHCHVLSAKTLVALQRAEPQPLMYSRSLKRLLLIFHKPCPLQAWRLGAQHFLTSFVARSSPYSEFYAIQVRIFPKLLLPEPCKTEVLRFHGHTTATRIFKHLIISFA